MRPPICHCGLDPQSMNPLFAVGGGGGPGATKALKALGVTVYLPAQGPGRYCAGLSTFMQGRSGRRESHTVTLRKCSVAAVTCSLVGLDLNAR